MKRMYILPAAAALGFCIAIFLVVSGNRTTGDGTPAVSVLQPPYDTYIAGAGLVEASTGNIAIGTPASGVVTEIFVKVGDTVKAGDPLFRIDDRSLQAQRLTAIARVDEASAALLKPKHRLAHAEQLKRRDPNAISAQDLDDLRDEAAQAEAALALAKAQLAQLQVEIELHTVRTLNAGEILQLRMRPGEFVEGTSLAPPLLLLGGDGRMHVRVDVDEHDAWRFQPGSDAVAFVRSHPQLRIPLHYEYTEPYIVPKTTLTGQSTERTDTRVLQAIYSFEHAALPIFVGQQLDVFIQAPASNSATGRP